MHKKASRRFHLIDAFFLLFLLGGLLGAGYLYWRWQMPEEPEVWIYRIEGELEAPFSRKEAVAEAMPVGARVTNAKGSIFLGEVRRVETLPLLRASVRDGEAVFVEVPDRLRVRITVIASGRLLPGEGVRISDLRFSAGGRGDFCVGMQLLKNAEILSVVRAEEQ